MSNWNEKMNDKISGWMQGRYGKDKLSKHLCILALILFVLFVFFKDSLFCTLLLFCLIISLYRSLSKDITKRRGELEAYEQMNRRIKNFWKMQKFRIKDGKANKYFLCSCGTIIRIPKGKGKIEVTCPRCKSHTIHNT